MRTRQLSRIAIGAVFLGFTAAIASPSAHAVEGCKVKVNARDGTLLVSAKNVAANPRWGFAPTTLTAPFTNEATCVVGGVAKKCELGAPGTAARITPPDLCTLYVGDDAATVCTAYVKGCVPGVRDASQGLPGPPGAPGDPGTPGSVGPAGPGAVVKDANGAVLGVLASLGGTITVLRNVGDKTVGLRTSLAAIIGSDDAFYYESGDCSGQALLPTFSAYTDSTSTLLYTVTTVRSGTVFYAPGTGQVLTIHSRQFEVGGCQSLTTTAAFAAPLMVDLSGLVPPFHVEVQ